MFNPASTYRIQFHKEFTFTHFEQIIPYLHKLGISTIYASPIFAAVPGSIHGYDGTNPHQINPEIGTEEQLLKISARLKELGMSWMQDIVPNHMAFHQNNAWLMDVLEKGEASSFASFFDIDWQHPDFKGKLMAPFLAAPPDALIEKNELQLAMADDKPVFACNGQYYPLNAASVNSLPAGKNTADSIAQANTDKQLLQRLLNMQYYALTVWSESHVKINYRRFFTINGLICLNMQAEHVFAHYHSYIKQLADIGVIQALRVDHVDGLYNPQQYFERLRKLCGEEMYITVEKILQAGERMPQHWDIQGTTGYDFLAAVNNLLTYKKGKKHLTTCYDTVCSNKRKLVKQVYEKKELILERYMQGELNNLTDLFISYFITAPETIQRESIKHAIGGLLARFPLYRSYPQAYPFDEEIKHLLERIFKALRHEKQPAEEGRKNVDYSGIDLLELILLGDATLDETFATNVLHFFRRCMQFSGPAMAKGVEDTLMYTYNRFTGHNEVGDTPLTFGLGKKAFHKQVLQRQKQYPLAMLATATHDTKHGEDMRARLNVITALHKEWTKLISDWLHKEDIPADPAAPDTNDLYMAMQLLVASWPELDEGDYKQRLDACIVKSLREAKEKSNWDQPNLSYEEATLQHIHSLLSDPGFSEAFVPFVAEVTASGFINSLSQLVIKHTAPGVADTYQGNECIDLSFVDPDNRRPVDYAKRERLLNSAGTSVDTARAEMLAQYKAGNKDAVKLLLTHILLVQRKNDPLLFTDGSYVPLKVKGEFKKHVFAFARMYNHTWLISIVPVHAAYKNKTSDKGWKDTRVLLPEEVPGQWTNIITGSKGTTSDALLLDDALGAFAVALIMLSNKPNNRGAGVLLPVASLPIDGPIGDLGPVAQQFVDFLSRSQQKYWQLLPINPVKKETTYSPYSSISCMAGNTLLISHELLFEAGLLDEYDMHMQGKTVHKHIHYEEAEKIKATLFEKAYRNFKQDYKGSMLTAFEKFCEAENYWLHDFALFERLCVEFPGSAWQQWPEVYSLRHADALARFEKIHADALNYIKWLQFIFTTQWKKLKAYSNLAGIKLIGDLPFYVSYHSVDVWANPGIFSLDEKRNMQGIAGVPPDYFSEDGQLWNMPTFNWTALKEQHYDWWFKRINKNLELFDLLRLDHFRAFEAYWEVPAGEKTARNGKWIKGPGAPFFKLLLQDKTQLPFIAEDLGEEMEDVYKLRETLGLPGMKVLQFAFGDNAATSVDAPHNYPNNCVVYPGTHDNNTTLGWFRHETDEKMKARIQSYTHTEPSEKNITGIMAGLAYGSVANIAIVAMQDLMHLDEHARMNTPGSDEGNWLWRLRPGELTNGSAKEMRRHVAAYNRM